MWTLVWTESRGSEIVEKYERFEHREQVVDFILKKGLEKDGDLLIFPPRQRNPV